MEAAVSGRGKRGVPNKRDKVGEEVTYRLRLVCPVAAHVIGTVYAEHDSIWTSGDVSCHFLKQPLRSGDGPIQAVIDLPFFLTLRCTACGRGPYRAEWPAVSEKLADMNVTGDMLASLG
jgi:hypothetical protein